jgi:predicted alpha/beta-hydrolase family hydrolase
MDFITSFNTLSRLQKLLVQSLLHILGEFYGGRSLSLINILDKAISQLVFLKRPFFIKIKNSKMSLNFSPFLVHN